MGADPNEQRQRAAAASLLVVENDARIVELVCMFLARRGYRVRSARTLEEARCELERAPADLMLSDIDLGRSNGREFLPQLSREGLLPPTLVVSGYLDAQLAEELSGVPQIVGVLAKPFEFDSLQRRVEQALASAAPGARRTRATTNSALDVSVP